MAFQGYNFYDCKTKTIKKKYQLWFGFRQLCIIMVQRGNVLQRFILIDRKGWKDGERIIKKKRK